VFVLVWFMSFQFVVLAQFLGNSYWNEDMCTKLVNYKPTLSKKSFASLTNGNTGSLQVIQMHFRCLKFVVQYHMAGWKRLDWNDPFRLLYMCYMQNIHTGEAVLHDVM